MNPCPHSHVAMICVHARDKSAVDCGLALVLHASKISHQRFALLTSAGHSVGAACSAGTRHDGASIVPITSLQERFLRVAAASDTLRPGRAGYSRHDARRRLRAAMRRAQIAPRQRKATKQRKARVVLSVVRRKIFTWHPHPLS